MRRPPTYPDLIGSPLLLPATDYINMTLTDCGAHHDCWTCQFFEIGEDAEGGEFCALEAAAIVGNCSPELARLFGWTTRASDPTWFDPPKHCPWFADKSAPPVPFDDPRQIDCFELADVPQESQE